MAQLQYNAPTNTNTNKKPEDEEKSVGGAVPQAVNPFTNTTAPSQAPTASKFTNVSSYLNANQGAGEKIANKVQTGLQRDIDKVDKSKTEASGVAAQVQKEKDRLAAASGLNTQVTADPTTIANNVEQLDAFKKLYTNQNIADSQQAVANKALTGARSAVDAAGANIGNLATEQGRFSLLDQNLNRPSYSQGQKRLDQLLFQVGGAKQLADAQQGLTGQLSSRDADLRKLANNLTGDIGSNRQAAINAESLLRGTTNTETTNLTKAQEEEAQKLSADRGAFNTYMNKILTTGLGETDDKALVDRVKSQLGTAGLSMGDRTYNTLSGDNYKRFIQEGKTNLDASGKDVVDQQEFDRYSALAKLAGLDPSALAFTQVGDRGPDAAIKAADLKSAIQADRGTLENNLRGNTSASSTYTPTVVGNRSADTWGATANADLLNWLNQQEGGASRLSGNITLSQNGQVLINGAPIGTDVNTGNAGIAGVDAPENANYAAKKLWDEYQRRLATGGYGNTFGNITPVKMGTVK